MMTKNEYIASIMLEAADILKNDNSYYYDIESIREDYNEYQSIINLTNESIALCESLNRVIDKYENNIYYSLNESVGSAVWEGIKKLCGKIRKWWNKFKNWVTGKNRVAKENGETVDPSKAGKVVDKVTKAYNSNKSMEDIDINDIKKNVKKGDPIPNYDSLDKKIEDLNKMIERETDEDKVARAREALNILSKINSGIAKNTELFLLPERGIENKSITYDKDGGRKEVVFTHNGYKEIMKYSKNNFSGLPNKYISTKDGKVVAYDRRYGDFNNPDYTRARVNDKGELKVETTKQMKKDFNDILDNKKYYVNPKGQASDTLNKKKKAANRRKQAAKEAARAKGKNINETIEFLYDEAILAETVEEFDTIMEAIEALEN